MSLTKLLPVILLMMATGVQASTRDETHQPEQKSRLPAGSASATAGRLTWPTGRWCCLCRGIALTVTSLTRY